MKVDRREGPITQGLTYFWTPLAILDKAGSEVLLAVRRCMRCASAPGDSRLILSKNSLCRSFNTHVVLQHGTSSNKNTKAFYNT